MDEDYSDYLTRAGRSTNAITHQFRIAYENDGGAFHVFLEGDDDKLFYLDEIRRRLANRSLVLFVCNGKRGVVASRDSIVPAMSDGLDCIFIIDRDHDDYLGCQASIDERTYITDNYSMESHLVNKDSVGILITDFIPSAAFQPRMSDITPLLDRSSATFGKALRPYVAISLAARSVGLKPNLNNVRLSDLVQFKPDGSVVRTKGGFSAFRRACGLAEKDIDFAAALAWMHALPDGEMANWLRGKDGLWHFECALKIIINFLADQTVPKPTNVQIPPPVRHCRILEAIGPRIAKPNSLISFLERTMIRV